MEDTKKQSLSLKDILKLIIAFIIPTSGYAFYVLDKDEHKELFKKVKLSSIIGAIIQGIILVQSIIYVIAVPNISASGLDVMFDNRTILFYEFLIVCLECAALLIGLQFIYVYKQEKTKIPHFRLVRGLFIIPTVVFAIGAIYCMDAVVDVLPKGIPFDSDSPLIAFYALFILFGASISYLIAVNKAYEYGYKRNIFETLLFIALPMGILGARLWWVISEWNRQLAGNHTLADILNFRNGGLAVQGGVLLGAFAGIWFVIEKRRQIPILRATDVIIPGILIAQAIGRLGNFTNVEVYGAEADPSAWGFLPQIVINQYINTVGKFYVPLFLIEALLNVLGYFVITYGVGKLCKKFIQEGDLTASYFIWYGIVRFIMEPLRDQEFIMGTSVQMSAAFIGIGIILIIINHLIRYLIAKNKLPSGAWKDKYLNFYNAKSKGLHILFALPLIDGVMHGLYRIAKGHYFSGVVWFILGAIIGWVIDLFCLLTNRPLVMSKKYV